MLDLVEHTEITSWHRRHSMSDGGGDRPHGQKSVRATSPQASDPQRRI